MLEQTEGSVAGIVRKKVSGSLIMSTKDVNWPAAARAYVAALKKARQEAPESVRSLAEQAH